METATISVREMPKPLWKRFKDKCIKRGVILHCAVIEAISDWVIKED